MKARRSSAGARSNASASIPYPVVPISTVRVSRAYAYVDPRTFYPIQTESPHGFIGLPGRRVVRVHLGERYLMYEYLPSTCPERKPTSRSPTSGRNTRTRPNGNRPETALKPNGSSIGCDRESPEGGRL